MSKSDQPAVVGSNDGLGGFLPWRSFLRGVNDGLELGPLWRWLRRRFCSHSFAIEDLEMVNRDSDGADRVAWPCAKCGKVFRAHCGLDISPEHGPTFRREPLNRQLT